MSRHEELLNHEKWHERRLQILERDARLCLHCGNNEILRLSRKASFQGFGLTWQSDIAMNAKTKFYYQITINDVETLDNFQTQVLVSFKDPLPDIRHLQFYYGIEVQVDGTQKCFVSAILDPESAKFIHVRGLQVHHSYYQEGKQPWEYPETALKTLCWICHQNLHTTQQVPWLDATGKIKGKLTPCRKCAGTGYLPQYDYYMNGVCFDCWGARYIEFTGAGSYL